MVWDSARAYNSCNVVGDGVNEGVKSHFIGTNRWLKTPPKQTKPAEPHWTERLPKIAQRSVAAKNVDVPKKVNIVANRTQTSCANRSNNNNSFDSEQQSWPTLPATKPSPRRTDIELLANGWEVVRDEDFHELEKQQVEQEGAEGEEEQGENDRSQRNQQPQPTQDASGFFNWIWCETKAPECADGAPESGSKEDEVVADTDHPLSVPPASFSYADALKR